MGFHRWDDRNERHTSHYVGDVGDDLQPEACLTLSLSLMYMMVLPGHSSDALLEQLASPLL